MLEKGTIVFGNWNVEEKIGSGAFGTVYKIKREEFGKVYYSALKVLHIPQDKDEYRRLKSEGMDDASISTYYSQVVQDFVSEIELLSSLDGITNIVDYKDHIIEANSDMGYTIYIKMQLLTPISKSLLAPEGSAHFMDVEEVIKLGKDMCSALEVCEKRNIIHRDIKIDNIFISENGDYKLGDFGIAKQLEATQGEMSQKGTLLYMAPEVFKGEKYDKTADIYSLGMVLYRLLNKNRAPFFPNYPDPIKFSDKETANIRRIKGEEIPDIIGISAELNAVLKKACAFNPKDRYLSASEFKAALKSVNVDAALQKFNETTSDSNAIVFEETLDDEATVGAFSTNSVTTIDNNEFENDKTEAFFNDTPVATEPENIVDKKDTTSVKEGKQGEDFLECEDKQHDFVAVEEYTGGTKYVCSRCGKTIHKSILFPSIECSDENNKSTNKDAKNETESTNAKPKNKKSVIIAVVTSIMILIVTIGIALYSGLDDELNNSGDISSQDEIYTEVYRGRGFTIKAPDYEFEGGIQYDENDEEFYYALLYNDISRTEFFVYESLNPKSDLVNEYGNLNELGAEVFLASGESVYVEYYEEYAAITTFSDKYIYYIYCEGENYVDICNMLWENFIVTEYEYYQISENVYQGRGFVLEAVGYSFDGGIDNSYGDNHYWAYITNETSEIEMTVFESNNPKAEIEDEMTDGVDFGEEIVLDCATAYKDERIWDDGSITISIVAYSDKYIYYIECEGEDSQGAYNMLENNFRIIG